MGTRMTVLLRRIIALVAAVAVGMGSMIVATSPAAAASADGFNFELVEGGAEITGCQDVCPPNLAIPSTVADITVVGISFRAFDEESLVALSLPASVEYVGPESFSGNEISVLTFAHGSQLKSIQSGAFHSNNIETLVVPFGVDFIGNAAFAENHLTAISFASNSILETIEAGAFFGNSLWGIEVPKGVSVIGDGAFKDNVSMSLVRFLGNMPSQLGALVFDGTGESPLYYREGASGWTSGQVINERTVTKMNRPIIESQPKSAKILAGAKAKLDVSANNSVQGQGDLTYQWLKNGSLISGARSSSYSASTAGSYSVRVSSWAGTTSSSTAKVTLIKRNQSVKLKLPSRLKRNKTYKLAKTSSAGAKVSWKVRGSGKCKIDRRNARIKCRVATGKRHVRIYGSVKGNSKYNSRKFHVNRRVR